MFNESKYTKCYFKLIDKYTQQTGEKHHILPKSLGGGNEIENIAIIPPRVHFILHKLLVKMVTSNKHKIKMQQALWRMSHPQSKRHNRKYKVTGREYDRIKKVIIQEMKVNNPMHREDVLRKRRGVKRPEQSIVAKRRNEKYWEENGRPVRSINCFVCNKEIKTRVPTQRFCSRKCFNIKRK